MKTFKYMDFITNEGYSNVATLANFRVFTKRNGSEMNSEMTKNVVFKYVIGTL